MRCFLLFKHCPINTFSAISAIFSQLPCFSGCKRSRICLLFSLPPWVQKLHIALRGLWVLKLPMTNFILIASLYHSSAICLMNFAQSFFVFHSVISMCLLPFKGSEARKIVATPHRSYSKSSLTSCPGLIAVAIRVPLISCLGDSSMQTTGNASVYSLLYTSNTYSIFATNSLFCRGGMIQPCTFQGFSSFF